jgi:16S rRNA processing protein RimM
VVVGFVTNLVEARTTAGAVLFADGEPLTVTAARPHKNKWLLTFDGYRDRNAVETLRGRALEAPPLDESSLTGAEADGVATEVVAFVHQLIGKTLVDQHGTAHGEVVAVVDNPASDLLELSDGRLVPLSFHRGHDEATVQVEVPAGLLDDQAISDGTDSAGPAASGRG